MRTPTTLAAVSGAAGDARRFSGRVALVTGAAGNIGLAVAQRLASEGAHLALLDLDRTKLQAAVETLREAGAVARAFSCDVGEAAEVRDAVAQAETELGSIGLLFNNAGYQGAFRPVHEYPEQDFERVLRVNVLGAFHVLREVSRRMVARRSGRIVNTASMAGVQGPPNMAAYGASKFAIVGLTQTAAKDLAPHGIRVNAISPAFIGPGIMWERQVQLQSEANSQYFSTDPAHVARQMLEMVPMRRYGAVEEIAAVVAFLLSDEASYLTGINVPIAGGIV